MIQGGIGSNTRRTETRHGSGEGAHARAREREIRGKSKRPNGREEEEEAEEEAEEGLFKANAVNEEDPGGGGVHPHARLHGAASRDGQQLVRSVLRRSTLLLSVQ